MEASMAPLAISAVRLLVITVLFTGNLAAVFRVYRLPKYKGVLSSKRITILTILFLNLLYLSTIWVPFTITTFKHNIQDYIPRSTKHIGMPSGYVVEYVNIHNDSVANHEGQFGRVVEETAVSQLFLPDGQDSEELMLLGYDGVFQIQRWHSSLSKSLNNWIVRVQDLITSAFTYSLVLAGFMKKLMEVRGAVVSRVQAIFFAGVFALLPLPLILAVRELADTNNLFALHTPEVKSGFIMYSIICDVNITSCFFVGFFVEWITIHLAAFLLIVLTNKFFIQQSQEKREDNCPVINKDCCRLEDVACSYVLLTGSGWALLGKPILAMILFCIYGPHWNNAVCWLANLVVATAVSFMPLVVFLARPVESKRCGVNAVSIKDGKSDERPKDTTPQDSDMNSVCTYAINDGKSPLPSEDVSSHTNEDVLTEGSKIRENLKLYLGTDIFKHQKKKDDEVCVLINYDGNNSTV